MGKKIAYVTVDDSPSKLMKEKVDYLLSKSIPAVFFCRGDFLEKRMKDVVYAIKNGFIVGNHAYSHKRFSELNLKDIKIEITKTDAFIEKAYKKAGIERTIKCFRFPYGNSGGKNKEKIQKFLETKGYKKQILRGITYDWWDEFDNRVDTYWTFDIREYEIHREKFSEINSIKDVFNHLKDKSPKRGGSLIASDSAEVILIHDHEETHKIFKKLIDRLTEMEIEFRLPESSPL